VIFDAREELSPYARLLHEEKRNNGQICISSWAYLYTVPSLPLLIFEASRLERSMTLPLFSSLRFKTCVGPRGLTGSASWPTYQW
jgi:hypothetical protein